MRDESGILADLSKLTAYTGRGDGVWIVYDGYTMTTARADGTRYISAPSRYMDGTSLKMREYRPLAKYPDLFLQFARLADDGGIDLEEKEGERNKQVALKWIREYGVLGLTFPGANDQHWGCNPRGGRGDTVATFAEEAWTANATLRLYSAATNPDGVDMDTIALYLPESHKSLVDTPSLAVAWAEEQVAININYRLANHTYLQLSSRLADGRHIEAHDFRSLIGAMYLQAMWMLIADRPGRCRNPKCRDILTIERPGQQADPSKINDRGGGYATRSDKQYCTKKCKDAHYYERETKPLRKAQQARRKGVGHASN